VPAQCGGVGGAGLVKIIRGWRLGARGRFLPASSPQPLIPIVEKFMTDQDFQFFKELVEAPSPSGFEQPAQRVIRRALEGWPTNCAPMCSATSSPPSTAPPVPLVSCSPGTATRSAHGQVYRRARFPLLRADRRRRCPPVPGQRVTVHAAGGRCPVWSGRRPIHQLETAERDKVMPFKSQFIDIGCPDRAAAGALVAVGDPVTFAVGVERLQGTRLTSRAFDDQDRCLRGCPGAARDAPPAAISRSPSSA